MLALGLIWEPKEYKAKQGKYDRVLDDHDFIENEAAEERDRLKVVHFSLI